MVFWRPEKLAHFSALPLINELTAAASGITFDVFLERSVSRWVCHSLHPSSPSCLSVSTGIYGSLFACPRLASGDMTRFSVSFYSRTWRWQCILSVSFRNLPGGPLRRSSSLMPASGVCLRIDLMMAAKTRADVRLGAGGAVKPF